MTDKEYRDLYSKSKTEAQNALFYEYINYVYAIVYNKLRSCGTKEDIEECVSDIFSAVFLSYDNQNNLNGDLKGFIGTIANRKAINRFKSISLHNNRTVYLEDESSDISDYEQVEEITERSQIQNTLIKIINSLGKPDSTIIFQKFYFNLSSREIAKKLSMNPTAVRMRCSRAIKKLKEILSAEGFALKED